MSNKDEYIIVSAPVASIYKKPSFSSELITQALIWEELIISDKKNNWYKIKQKDNYLGWIHSFYIVNSRVYNDNPLLHNPDNWYWVKDRFLKLNLNNKTTYLISYGSLLPCFKEEIFFTILPNNERVVLDEKSLIKYNNKENFKKNLLFSVNQLLGVPYLWGGKSSYGFDCSGLIQSLFQVSSNILLPRDASLQIQSNLIKSIELPKIGDIIFFKINKKVSHVGIYINDNDFIHASGDVKINSIDKKRKYYSKKLEINYYKTYRTKVEC